MGWVKDNFFGGKAQKESKKARRSAEAASREQLTRADRQFEYQKQGDLYARRFAENERDYQRRFIEGERSYARQFTEGERDYQRKFVEDERGYRRGLVSDMLAEADLDATDYARALGKVSAQVRDSFSRAREQTRREQARYGVNPSSGRFQAEQRRSELAQAAAESAQLNQTRTGLDIFEREQRQKARVAGLTSPALGPVKFSAPQLSVGRVAAPRVNARDAGIDVLGQKASDQYGFAQQFSSQASNQIANTMGTIGKVAGSAISAGVGLPGLSSFLPGGGGLPARITPNSGGGLDTLYSGSMP